MDNLEIYDIKAMLLRDWEKVAPLLIEYYYKVDIADSEEAQKDFKKYLLRNITMILIDLSIDAKLPKQHFQEALNKVTEELYQRNYVRDIVD